MTYPRDLVGYGSTPPDPQWPGRACVALQLVMNYEEGGERSILHGDAESEAFLHEVVATEPLPGVRNMNVESVYEYGSRAGFWRLLRMFADRNIKITVYAVAMALERHPEAAASILEAGRPGPGPGGAGESYPWIVAGEGFRPSTAAYVL